MSDSLPPPPPPRCAHHPPCPSREALASQEPLCPGQSWAGNHVPGVWPSILIHDPSWHFPAPGTPSAEYSLQRPGLGKGYGTPGTLGLSRCGCGVVRGIRTQCSNTVSVLLGLRVSQRPGQEYNRPCFHEPGGQERALLTNLASQVTSCAVWAGLRCITSLRVKSISHHDHFCYGQPCLQLHHYAFSSL